MAQSMVIVGSVWWLIHFSALFSDDTFTLFFKMFFFLTVLHSKNTYAKIQDLCIGVNLHHLLSKGAILTAQSRSSLTSYAMLRS